MVLTKWKIDPTVIKDSAVAIFDVLQTVDDVGKNAGLRFEPAG
jgi:hypothetical protein